jgi:hypothetical protein
MTCCRERCHWRSSRLVLYFSSLYGLVVALEIWVTSHLLGVDLAIYRETRWRAVKVPRRFSPLPAV